jgi:hypothetical protein
MAVQRPIVGQPTLYRDRLITVRMMGPDMLSFVDDEELSGFFISEQAAVAAGQRYINDAIKAKERK